MHHSVTYKVYIFISFATATANLDKTDKTYFPNIQLGCVLHCVFLWHAVYLPVFVVIT